MGDNGPTKSHEHDRRFQGVLNRYGILLPPLQPREKKITHITRNKTNRNFAIPADAAAIPPNPSTAAINAIIRKVTAQPRFCFTSFTAESQQGTGLGFFCSRALLEMRALVEIHAFRPLLIGPLPPGTLPSQAPR
jgi:hypothetical protein